MGENSEVTLRKDVNSVLETNALKRSTSFSRKGSGKVHCVVKIFNGQSINFDFKVYLFFLFKAENFTLKLTYLLPKNLKIEARSIHMYFKN